ncbi:HET-domain-containing protein, partial [Lepidopterella palustris CBS 459.81]
MRLLRLNDDSEFSLVEFVGKNIPGYAILSHTWGADHEEVTFKDLVDGTGKSKAGYKKIRFCGTQAASDGLQFFWVDTCCINKSSSAELSEAINSMYSWYQQAKICYAYLNDVPSTKMFSRSYLFDDNEYKAWKECFLNSKWWSRGWTLQELIAPREVQFYSKHWGDLGTRHKHRYLIANHTGINEDILDKGYIGKASVAQRMCWASKRKTTRVEDMAYCLMGIFELNMPLLYGEGDKAFIRLQEEIIKASDDHSIFAWTSEVASQSAFRGLLAKSPSEFQNCRNITAVYAGLGEPYSLTNRGLRVTLPVL